MSEEQKDGNKRIRPQERARSQKFMRFFRERDSAMGTQVVGTQKEDICRIQIRPLCALASRHRGPEQYCSMDYGVLSPGIQDYKDVCLII